MSKAALIKKGLGKAALWIGGTVAGTKVADTLLEPVVQKRIKKSNKKLRKRGYIVPPEKKKKKKKKPEKINEEDLVLGFVKRGKKYIVRGKKAVTLAGYAKDHAKHGTERAMGAVSKNESQVMEKWGKVAKTLAGSAGMAALWGATDKASRVAGYEKEIEQAHRRLKARGKLNKDTDTKAEVKESSLRSKRISNAMKLVGTGIAFDTIGDLAAGAIRDKYKKSKNKGPKGSPEKRKTTS